MKPANFPFKAEVKCFVYIQFVKFDQYSLNSVKLAHRKISTRRVCHLCSPVRYLYTSEVLQRERLLSHFQIQRSTFTEKR